MIRKNFYLVILAVFISCSDSVVEEMPKVLVSPTDKSVVPLDEAFDDVHILPLDDSGILLGIVNNLQMHKGDIYILTGSRTNGIYRFNDKGEFLNAIGVRGDGPGEYGYIRNFAFSGDTVFVIDSEKMRVNRYSIDGEYLNTIDTGLFAFDISPLSSGGFMLYTGNAMDRKVIKFNDSGDQEEGYLSVNADQSEFLNIIPQKVFTKGGLFLEPFSYQVYRAADDGLVPYVDLDFGKFRLPEDKLAGPYDNVAVFFNEIRKAKHAFLFLEFFESTDHFSFSFEFGGMGVRQQVFVDKNTLTQNTFSGYIENTLSAGTQLASGDFKLVGSNDEQFVFLLETHVLLDGGEALKDNSIKVDDNPILYFVKPKK